DVGGYCAQSRYDASVKRARSLRDASGSSEGRGGAVGGKPAAAPGGGPAGRGREDGRADALVVVAVLAVFSGTTCRHRATTRTTSASPRTAAATRARRARSVIDPRLARLSARARARRHPSRRRLWPWTRPSAPRYRPGAGVSRGHIALYTAITLASSAAN